MGDRKKYWVGFSHVTGIGPVRIRALLSWFGSLEAAWGASRQDLQAAGMNQAAIDSLIKTRDGIDLEAAWEELCAAGVDVLTWDEAAYPTRLLEIHSPPPLLYVKGRIESRDRWAVAIVGTRQTTPYGQAVCREVASCLASHGITIISGLARGIDGIAHRTALESGGRTIAVLGSGLDRIYPPEHRGLANKIASDGALVSDYPFGTRPEARNFPARNRIISGLALITVVVEAGVKSGALITADFALEQGREVFAVPGEIHNRTSQGTNKLIQFGAHPLLSPEDILEALNLDVILRHEAAENTLPEDEAERRILMALSTDPTHVDDLHVRIGMPVASVTSALAVLELKGRVRQVGGMHYVRMREGSPGYRVE